ncbi:hypothetical protein R1flu_022979 [Riccia fluitans]|uniref:Aminotransferase class V domain-containing protein n=1 Tax=Riccia fluitans TaxID=41844 RepID=A0ABD1XQQ5_9MARC
MLSEEDAAVEKFQQLNVTGDVREKEFNHHEEGVAQLNHGSFGSCPISVQTEQAQWMEKWFKQPDTFIYHHMEVGFLDSRRTIAGLINSPSVDEVLLVDNVTTAASMIAQDLVWGFLEGRYQKGDAILLVQFLLRSFQTMFRERSRTSWGLFDLRKNTISCLFSIACSRIFSLLPRLVRVIRLAVIDHITSMPSILLPVKEMVRLCRSHGVEQVLVDGAHALGNVEVGTRDYFAQLAVPAAAEFIQRETGGLESLRHFNHNSAVAKGNLLANEWGTVCGAPAEMATAMVMVGLPPILNVRSFDEGLQLRTRLCNEFQVEVPLHHVLEEDQGDADRVAKIPCLTAYARPIRSTTTKKTICSFRTLSSLLPENAPTFRMIQVLQRSSYEIFMSVGQVWSASLLWPAP